jgi:7-cyano-7-deazaguanine synthase
MSKSPAIVLLSGGLDSATTLAIAKGAGYVCHALSFDYGQRHDAELLAATAVAEDLGVASHRIIPLDLRALGGSALTDDALEVPKNREESTMAGEIPVTYVPARNTIFLSYALAAAEVLGSTDLFIGVNAVDYSGYPDCRPEFIQAFATMANLATKAGVSSKDQPLKIHTPLIDWTKTKIIEYGLSLGVNYGLTHSCYDPVPDANHPLKAKPCGQCDSCIIRRNAFEHLGQIDPAAVI